MRYVLMATVGVASLALAGCSQSDNSVHQSGGGSGTANSVVRAPQPAMRDGDAPTAPRPGIAVTAAPGVAFTYRYAFRLPAAKLAGAQEAHAQACEKLGIAHCRITGMRYRVLGENSNEGMLLFKLDPSLARAFGKQGIDAIVAAEGKLADAEITGTDAAAEIPSCKSLKAQADRRIAADRPRTGAQGPEGRRARRTAAPARVDHRANRRRQDRHERPAGSARPTRRWNSTINPAPRSRASTAARRSPARPTSSSARRRSRSASS